MRLFYRQDLTIFLVCLFWGLLYVVPTFYVAEHISEGWGIATLLFGGLLVLLAIVRTLNWLLPGPRDAR